MSDSPPEGRSRGVSVSESTFFRGSVSARTGKGGRGRGAQNSRRASSRMSDDGFEMFDPPTNEEDDGLGEMASYIDEIAAEEEEVTFKPPPRPTNKPPPPPGAPRLRAPSTDGASFPLMKPKPPPPGGPPPNKPKPPPPSGPPPSKPKPPPPGGAPPTRSSLPPTPADLPPKRSSANNVPPALPPKRSSTGTGGGSPIPSSPPSAPSRPLPPTPTSVSSSPSITTAKVVAAPRAFMPPPPPTSGNKAPVIPSSPPERVSEAPNISPRPITKASHSNNQAFSLPVEKNEANYEVVIHSSMFKRGKMKWNQRYCVLIKPRQGNGGLLFYFKNAKQFMKQASSGGSVSVDVARLFAAPSVGKEVPKELDLKGCRVEPNADGWSTPTGTFGLMIVDDKGVEYPFATDSNQMRNLWITGLDGVMHEDPNLLEDDAAFTSPVVPLVVKNTTFSSMSSDLSSPIGSSRSMKDDNSRRGQQTGLFDVASTGLVYELVSPGIHTVHVKVAHKLLSDRRFLTSRRSVEIVMRELLTYMGDPGQIPGLLARTMATDSEELIVSFLGRLIELLSLEPIDSPATSRIVGCVVAILAAWAKGSPISHRILATYPLLGELSFELRQLIAKTDHPGLLNQVSTLLVGLYSPTLVPICPEVIVCKDQIVKLNVDTDIEDLATTPPPPAVVSDGKYLDFLKRDKCPLWPILFKLMTSTSEKPRVNVLSLLSDLSSFPEVCVAICSAHETPQPKDRKSAAVMVAGNGRGGAHSHRKHQAMGASTSLDIDSTFVEDVDDDEDTFNANPIGLESIFQGGGNGNVPETSNPVMTRSGRAIASIPRSRNALSAGSRQGSMQSLPRVRSGVASSLPRGGISPLSRTGHSASSPHIQLPSQPFSGAVTVKRRSPVVAHLVNLLSAEHGDETRYFALSFMCNLLTQAQALNGYEPVLRAVCTPDVMSATDLLSSIHAKAKRHISEASVIVANKRQMPRSASVFSMDSAGFGDDTSQNRKPITKLLSLGASANLAIHEEIAQSSALSLWLIGCLLTQHHAMASIRGIKATESFTTFCEKLAQNV